MVAEVGRLVVHSGFELRPNCVHFSRTVTPRWQLQTRPREVFKAVDVGDS